MRRILLVAFAMLLMHAAPSMAAECSNLALATNGGVASVSSAYDSRFGAQNINNNTRENSTGFFWRDGTPQVWPDWAQIEWSTPTRIDQLRIRTITSQVIERTMTGVHVQYWDGALATWVDVSSAQPNPIPTWRAPQRPTDGSEIKQFDFVPLTTTKVRVLVTGGGGYGNSFLDEIEAYDRGSCGPPPTECTAEPLDSTASASSVHSSGLYPVSAINNGERESGTSQGYWNDDTNGDWPDWAQIEFAQPTSINRIVARIPLARRDFSTGEITLRRTRIQYYDDAASSWVDVVGAAGQDNPVLDWTGPIDVYDGSESRTFDIAAVTTTKVRALIEEGATDGWSWLDELEAYGADCITTPRDVNLSLSGTAVAASSADANHAPRFVNDGRRQTTAAVGFWNEGSTPVDWNDWVAVEWTAPRSINRMVLRLPYLPLTTSTEWRTQRQTRVQYWDDVASLWVDVVGRAGQDNPILDWMMPLGATDGSEIRQFDFPTVSTPRVRAWVQLGSPRYASLEELETYWVS